MSLQAISRIPQACPCGPTYIKPPTVHFFIGVVDRSVKAFSPSSTPSWGSEEVALAPCLICQTRQGQEENPVRVHRHV